MRTKILLAFSILFLAACGPDGAQQAARPSVYDDVMARGSINCGYAVYPPYFTKDANTGQLGGLMYDVLQEAAKRLNLTVNYTTEVGWGTVVDDLKNRKVDMACSYFWANSTRGRFIEFTQPVVYDRLWLYVRADDTRTWPDYESMNREDMKVALIDGGAENKIVDIWFPKAQRVSLTELAPSGDWYETVASGKADFLTSDENSAAVYMTANPGKLKKLEMPVQIHTFPGVMLMPPGDFRFKSMIDTALREMELDGTMTTLIKKNGMDGKVGRNIYMK